MKRALIASSSLCVVALTLSCNNGPSAPSCQTFFSAGATADVTLAGQVGPAPSCVVNNKQAGMAASQSGCSFTIGSQPFNRITGTIEANGSVSIDSVVGMTGCSGVQDLAGTGTISGATITGTLSSPSSSRTQVSFTIRKP